MESGLRKRERKWKRTFYSSSFILFGSNYYRIAAHAHIPSRVLVDLENECIFLLRSVGTKLIKIITRSKIVQSFLVLFFFLVYFIFIFSRQSERVRDLWKDRNLWSAKKKFNKSQILCAFCCCLRCVCDGLFSGLIVWVFST